MQSPNNPESPAAIDDGLDDTVWVSPIMNASVIQKHYMPREIDEDFKKLSDLSIRNRRDEPQPEDSFPNTYYWMKPGKRYSNPGHLMYCDIPIISTKCADVLRTVNLGRTSLYPVNLMDSDRKTPIPGTYFSINFGETKRSVIIEKSEVKFRYDQYGATDKRKPNSLCIDSSALKGPDLWIDDTIRFCVFMTGRLVRALRKAKLDTLFEPVPCVIAE